MRNLSFGIAILLIVGCGSAALAEEVIYFTNGTVMAIRSHKVEGDTIKVDLGDNGFMAFPSNVVDRIEQAPEDLVLMPSTTSNQMFESDPSTRVFGASPRQASTSWQLPMKMDTQDDPSAPRAIGGVVSVAPYANDPHPALRKLRVNNVPSMRGGNEHHQSKLVPGAPQKLPNPAIKQKKVLTEFKAKK
jgi:hypothetical protein